ncbi:YTH domain-containing protein ECT3 [Cardamine amara subsp. amara]|uniref:YTH domain-containing family protein n=1 Tax=Cardamine amara subsp. amara TaxID=228776 RepID=A0ABD1BI69_CARAN
MANSDHVSDVLHNLSLDPKANPLALDSENKGAYGGNGNDYLLNGELLEATKMGKPSLLSKDGDLAKDKVSNPKKLGYQSSAWNPKGSYGKGGAYPYGFYSPAYQYPRYGYNGSYASGKTNQHYQYLTQHQGRSAGAGYGYGSYGYDAWKHMPNWYAVDNCYKSRNGFHGYGKENIEGLNELNRGPRAKGFKSQEGSKVITVSSKEQIVTESEKLKEDADLLDPQDYNKKDFPETFSEAKFFVIKSYSEDDIHKSIKYNVWSSTPNGNKKLDASYNEANQKSDACPVFLLFSVNTSGQFVGLAEMVGPVDFNKTVEYWQQDKWIGCFPVKWHFVKDIPNSSLRHITLENNENKPVTNSRDTQEVKLEQGMKVIKIFKDHASKTSILDDFVFYESRQKIIQERKSKHMQFKKQGLVTNLVKTQESTTASEDSAALGGATEVKENDLAVTENAVAATAC